MPLLVDSTLVGNASGPVSAPQAEPTPNASDGKGSDPATGDGADDAHANDGTDREVSEPNHTDLLIDAFAIATFTDVPMPTDVPVPTSVCLPSDDAQLADVLWQAGEVDFPLNRAERRAQQRQDAHAMRNQRKRRR
jgi:hypothetical protein